MKYEIEKRVVPHAGTWIEIGSQGEGKAQIDVVPHTGTWIEIKSWNADGTIRTGRSPHGNVD